METEHKPSFKEVDDFIMSTIEVTLNKSPNPNIAAIENIMKGEITLDDSQLDEDPLLVTLKDEKNIDTDAVNDPISTDEYIDNIGVIMEKETSTEM